MHTTMRLDRLAPFHPELMGDHHPYAFGSTNYASGYVLGLVANKAKMLDNVDGVEVFALLSAVPVHTAAWIVSRILVATPPEILRQAYGIALESTDGLVNAAKTELPL